MEVLKVIVDEMPEGCFECDLMSAILPPSCQAYMTHGQFTLIPDVYTRPVWCPLVTVDKAFDWMMYENPATPYIEQAITDWAKGNEPEYFKKAGDK